MYLTRVLKLYLTHYFENYLLYVSKILFFLNTHITSYVWNPHFWVHILIIQNYIIKKLIESGFGSAWDIILVKYITYNIIFIVFKI